MIMRTKILIGAGVAIAALLLWRRRASAAPAGTTFDPADHPLLDPYSEEAVQDCSGRIGVENPDGTIRWVETWQEGCD